MSITEDLPWTCRCGTANVSRARKSWALGQGYEDAVALATVIDDTFHRFPCTQCGFQAVVDRDLLLIHHDQKWAIQVAHNEGEVVGLGEALARGFAGYRTRVVGDRRALVERARLLSRGIDDVAIECVRYFVRVNQGIHFANEPRNRVLLERIEADCLVWSVWMPGKPPGTLKTPLAVLNNVMARYGTARHLAGPFVDELLVRELMQQSSTR
jgi:hypothetical protein